MNEIVKAIRAMNKKKMRTTLERLVYTEACGPAIEMILKDLNGGKDPDKTDLNDNKTLAHELVYLRGGDPIYDIRWAVVDTAKYQLELDGGVNTRDLLLLLSLKYPDLQLTPITGIPREYKRSIASVLKLSGFEMGHVYKKDLQKTVRVWTILPGFDHLSTYELQVNLEKQIAVAQVAIDRTSENPSFTKEFI